MIAARLSLLLLFSSMMVAADQTDQGWTEAGVKNGVTLTFRDDPQLECAAGARGRRTAACA